MFDTMKIAKKIREARITRNLTQMNLADAMGVSYQAVSNWERGNSMPDISKLEDLCKALQLSVTELLGMETLETTLVSKLMQTEETLLSMEELAEIAPVLPPEEVKKQAKKQKLDLSALTGIAPFLDEDFLAERIEDADVESLEEIAALAPFLGEDVLDALVRKAPKRDRSGIIALAPFLEEETLDWLVKQCDFAMDREFLTYLAPFLEEETLDWLIKQCDFEKDRELLTYLVPFLEEETIDALVQEQIDQGKLKDLDGLYPFMGEDTLRKVVRALMAEGDLEGVKNAAPFL